MMVWIFIGLVILAAILLWCMSDGGKQPAELHIVIDPTMEKDRALLVAPDCFDEQGNPDPTKIVLITNIGVKNNVS